MEAETGAQSAPTTTSLSSAPKFMARSDLTQQGTSLSAKTTFSKFKLFFNHFTLWLDQLFPQKSRLFEFSSTTRQNQGESLKEYFRRGHRQAIEARLYNGDFGPKDFEVLVLQKGMLNLEQNKRLLREAKSEKKINI